MKRSLVVALAGLMVLGLACQPHNHETQAPNVIVTMAITIKSGNEDVKAFVAMPGEGRTTQKGKGPFPGILVIHEWWGLNDWIKQNAEHFAQKGFVALAPDLYHGKVTDDPKIAAQLMQGLPKDRALMDLKAAVDELAAMDNVQKDKIGSIGWCVGGVYSLQAALHDQRITSCVVCYGAVVTDPDKLKPLNAKVLGIFGENDLGIKVADVRAFEQALIKAGKSVEKISIYAGAGHGFMRPRNGAQKNPDYREAIANSAWEQIDAFFNSSLKK
jgi:carboxymethylenebutenolidase